MVEKTADTVYLVEDAWNDWFTYSTLYNMKYVDAKGRLLNIGSVKIGERNQNTRRPELPDEFEYLSNDFFSLGVSDNYYQQLNNNLEAVLRERILISLNDIALNLEFLSDVLVYDVTNTSLLRDTTLSTVKGQYHRMALGGARLTDYDFSYTFPNSEIKIEFGIEPEQMPPTNIHVLIGKNGVGKTTLIKNMVLSLEIEDKDQYGKFEMLWSTHSLANIVFVSFSVFDQYMNIDSDNIPYLNIGLSTPENGTKSYMELADEFVECLYIITKGDKKKLWKSAIAILESDNTFIELNIKSWDVVNYDTIRFRSYKKKYPKEDVENKREYTERIEKIYFLKVVAPKFRKLSSGHKVILLTIAKLVEKVEEKTLVLLDEPEEHLHPPLVSAFITALLNLLIYRNGVGIIATHSPVIVQEVPRKCVWILRRSGDEMVADRPQIETFGENLGILTSEIFGFEVTNSEFHKMLNEVANKNNTYKRALSKFSGELGEEGKTILRNLIYEKKTAKDDDNG